MKFYSKRTDKEYDLETYATDDGGSFVILHSALEQIYYGLEKRPKKSVEPFDVSRFPGIAPMYAVKVVLTLGDEHIEEIGELICKDWNCSNPITQSFPITTCVNRGFDRAFIRFMQFSLNGKKAIYSSEEISLSKTIPVNNVLSGNDIAAPAEHENSTIGTMDHFEKMQDNIPIPMTADNMENVFYENEENPAVPDTNITLDIPNEIQRDIPMPAPTGNTVFYGNNPVPSISKNESAFYGPDSMYADVRNAETDQIQESSIPKNIPDDEVQNETSTAKPDNQKPYVINNVPVMPEIPVPNPIPAPPVQTQKYPSMNDNFNNTGGSQLPWMKNGNEKPPIPTVQTVPVNKFAKKKINLIQVDYSISKQCIELKTDIGIIDYYQHKGFAGKYDEYDLNRLYEDASAKVGTPLDDYQGIWGSLGM